jgi:hypothetical protein
MNGLREDGTTTALSCLTLTLIDHGYETDEEKVVGHLERLVAKGYMDRIKAGWVITPLGMKARGEIKAKNFF